MRVDKARWREARPRAVPVWADASMGGFGQARWRVAPVGQAQDTSVRSWW